MQKHRKSNVSPTRLTTRGSVHAERLADVADRSVDAIIDKDLQGIVRSWSSGAERLFGFAAGEMIGQSITRIVPAERLSEEASCLERVARGESVELLETRRLRKDHSQLAVSLHISYRPSVRPAAR